jgi:serine protease Do
VRERQIFLAAALSGFLGAGAAILVVRPEPKSLAADPPTREQIGDASRAFRQVAKLLRPSVVHLTRERVVEQEPNPFEQMFRPDARRRPLKERSFGTGFIVKADGTCLTNNHVAGGGEKLLAKLADGREVEATVLGTDAATDVCVVKLGGPGPYTPVALGDSDAIEVGDWALAFGCPFGLEQTVTSGIISAKGRSRVGIAAYEDFLQTDAAINPGNSGGPLVDIQGRVIGINTAIASSSGGYQGVGFTIPINMAKAILESILKTGYVVRGWLGVVLDPAEMQGERPASGQGALIKDVAPGGPAANAGIKPGDRIVGFDGKPVEDGVRLRLLAAAAVVGRTVPVTLVRDGKNVEVQLVVAERTAENEKTATREEATVGITAKKLTPELAERLGLPKDATGVAVTEVAPGSLAAQAGIRAGHVLRAIDGRAIRSMDDLDAAVKAMDVRAGIKITVADAEGDHTVILRAR